MKRLDDFLQGSVTNREQDISSKPDESSIDTRTVLANDDKAESGTGKVKFRFAHMADCHLGAFREEHLRELNLQAFERAIDVCIDREVDFVVISGDLFHRSFPDLGITKRAVEKMKMLVDKGIRIYLIYGSHDYAANTTNLIDVLGSAGLFQKVFVVDSEANLSPVIDEGTGAELMGISGRTQALEREYYGIVKAVPQGAFSIFMFHTAIKEFRPENVPQDDAIPESMLPAGFDYYAGGHVHEKIVRDRIVFPGPLFGADFRDLSALEARGFFVVDVDGRAVRPEFAPVRVADFELIDLDFSGMDSREASDLLLQRCGRSFAGKVVLLDLHGSLKSGSVAEIDVSGAKREVLQNGAEFAVMNRSVTSEARQTLIASGSTREEIENKLFDDLFGNDRARARTLFSELSMDQEELGMSRSDFESEVERRGVGFFGLEE
ncbi:MAG: DNA repair exonuclease [Candidatus Thermoplasmatota archaeon]|nr:DNA repair exonuclease [Candidatus Thermoplasmatota archaeon]